MSDEFNRLGLIDDEELILDEAAIVLALLDHTGLDGATQYALLDRITERLIEIGGKCVEPHDQANALSFVLNGEFGFVGDEETYDDPANADLLRVLDRRRGLPVSLSILYVAAARRLGWTANVLDVPGHVLVLIGQKAAPVILDPFRGGVLVDRDRLAALVRARNGNKAPAVTHISTMANRAVLVRLLQNQASRAEQAGQGRRALTLYQRMTAFASDHSHPWWEAARLQLVDGDVSAARASLSSMLEVTREPELRGRISDILSSLAES